jgi:hypothetical protein
MRCCCSDSLTSTLAQQHPAQKLLVPRAHAKAYTQRDAGWCQIDGTNLEVAHTLPQHLQPKLSILLQAVQATHSQQWDPVRSAANSTVQARPAAHSTACAHSMRMPVNNSLACCLAVCWCQDSRCIWPQPDPTRDTVLSSAALFLPDCSCYTAST